MGRDPRRKPRRAGVHRAGVRRMDMPPIGGDGVDLNSELTLAGLRTVAREVEAMTDEQRLESIIATLGALLQVGGIIGPQYQEITEYMSSHDADGPHDERLLERIEGFIVWIHQLTPAEIVSLVAASASLLDLVRLAELDAPDEILGLFVDDDQPGG